MITHLFAYNNTMTFLKGHLTTSTSSPYFFSKSRFLYQKIHRHMKLLHACSYLQLLLNYKDIWISLFTAIFKGQLYKIASTITAVEFGTIYHYSTWISSWQVEQKPGGRGRGREWATLGVHPLSWLLSNNRLEKVPFLSVPHTSSNRLLPSNQDKGCTRSVAHSLPLSLGPALLNLWSVFEAYVLQFYTQTKN